MLNRKNGVPLPDQLKEELLSRIKNGYYKPGERIDTVRKLAAELGLAPSTVHRALSGHPSVSLNTRRTVLRASQKSGYLLPIHEKGSVAIIVPSFTEYRICAAHLPPCSARESEA